MKQAIILTDGTETAQQNQQRFNTPTHSSPIIDGAFNWRAPSLWKAWDVFNLLPATAATAGNDDLLLYTGTGAPVMTRSAKGGINLATRTATANSDIALLKPPAGCANIVPVTYNSQPRFSARVNLAQITGLLAGVGMDQNNTTPNLAATTGDGASFIFDPAQLIATTGLSAAQAANWILAQKVNGVYAYTATSVPVLAGVDYELEIQWGPDLTPTYFINGVQVGQGVAQTASASLQPIVGLLINNAAAPAQINMDVRFVAVERLIG